MTAPVVPSTSTVTPETPQQPPVRKRLVSPAYARYLDSQEAAIRIRGGSDEDVREFFRMEVNEPTFAKSLIERTTPKAGEVDPYIPPHLQGIAMSVLQGATAGWADEAIGWYRAKLTGLHPDYETELYRREFEAWASKNGKTRLAAEVAGGFLTGSALGTGKRAAAVMGAIGGAGYADGDLGDRVAGALLGATLGTAIAAGLGRVIKPIAAPIASRVVPKPLGDVVGTSPLARARERLRNAAIADGLNDIEAIKRINAMQRTGTPTTILEIGGDAVNALVQEASRAISPIKNAAREAFRTRQQASGERLTARLATAMFGNPKFASANARELKDQILADVADKVRPMYRQAYQQEIELSPRLVSLLEKYPKLRQAYNNAATRAASIDDALAGQELRGVPAQFTPGLRIDPLPDNLGVSAASLMQRFPGISEETARAMLGKMANTGMRVPLRAIDLMKRELDDIIESEVAQKFPGLTEREIKKIARERGKVLMEFRDEFVDEARKQSAVYDAALTQFGDAKDAETAIDLGLQFFRMRPDQIRKAIESRPPALRDFMRIGVLEAFNEKVAATEGSLKLARQFFGGQLHDRNAKGFLLSPQAQRIAALFPDSPEMADEFLRTASAEALAAFRTGAIMRRPAAGAAKKSEQLRESPIVRVRGSALVEGLEIGRQQLQQAAERLSQEEADEIMHLAIKGLRDPRELLGLVQTVIPRARTAVMAFGAKIAKPNTRIQDRLRSGTRAAAGTLGGKAGGAIGETIVP